MFRDSYVLCIYVMNILCTFHISVSWVCYKFFFFFSLYSVWKHVRYHVLISCHPGVLRRYWHPWHYQAAFATRQGIKRMIYIYIYMPDQLNAETTLDVNLHFLNAVCDLKKKQKKCIYFRRLMLLHIQLGYIKWSIHISFGLVSWHINYHRLLNAKSFLYIHIKYKIYKHIS